jgi:hypothetical protein
LEGKVKVLGYALEPDDEGKWRFGLFLQSTAPLEQDYTLWLHQYSEGVEDYESLDRLVETSQWRVGRVYEEEWMVEPRGEEIRLIFGFWRWEDGGRLWLKDSPDEHEIDLGWIAAD